MSSSKASVRPFGMRDKVGYLFGDFGNDFTFIFSTMMLMKFYTDVMGVSAGVVGLVMTVARIVDAFTDVTMGRICDRSRTTPAGKFKPWVRRMCVPVALASFLIYQSGLAGASMGVKIAYLFITYILWGSVFYTSINIPYGSMASAASAASAGLTGLLLEVIGYSAATRTDPVVQSGQFNISVLVPALGFALLAAILWFWYPLHKKQVDENVIALKAKHENEKN